MGATTKFTIRISPTRRDETITWSAVGQFGTLNLSTVSGQLVNAPLTSAATPEAYFAAILELVKNAL